MPIKETQLIAIWVEPQGDAVKELAKLQTSLRDYGRTEPLHLTLLKRKTLEELGLSQAELLSLVQVVASSMPDTIPFEVGNPSFSNQIYKFIFYQIVRSEALSDLYLRLISELGWPEPNPLDPHISLVYGGAPTSVKVQLARAMPAITTAGFFDALTVVVNHERIDQESGETTFELEQLARIRFGQTVEKELLNE